MGEPTKTIPASKIIRQMATEGRLGRIKPDRSRARGGRCFLWIGENANFVDDDIQEDLTDRLERWSWEKRHK